MTNWIEKTLDSLPFFKWDRFTIYCDYGDVLYIYGWINKDFVLLEFDLNKKEVDLTATSSNDYSKKIAEILGTSHQKCINVNGRFNVKNLK